MNDDLRQIGLGAMRLATRLPHSVMLSLADTVVQHGSLDWQYARSIILQRLPSAAFRDAASEFLNAWESTSPSLSPQVLAAALVTAAEAELTHEKTQVVEIVWTGPEGSDHQRYRQTEQAVLEVLNSAKDRLTIASYALYRIPRIRDSLITAANRGVKIRLILETPDKSEGRSEYDNLVALGDKVSQVSTVYYWPHETRRKDSNGKTGILHVKCAIADGRRLFLTSANLTEYAFTTNMELGILITGGTVPSEIQAHFDRLISLGFLVPLTKLPSL